MREGREREHVGVRAARLAAVFVLDQLVMHDRVFIYDSSARVEHGVRKRCFTDAVVADCFAAADVLRHGGRLVADPLRETQVCAG